MADKETDLKLTVGAVADKGSAKKVVQDITKEVNSTVKGGRIEIPVELKAPIKGASDDLIKAQEDVIKKWEAASKKGFSSSSKEADALIASYTKFKRLVGLAHKNNQTQVKDLDKIMAKQVQAIKIMKTAKQVETKSRKTTTKKDKYNPDFGKHSNAEIKANEKAYKDRLYKGVKSTGPKGFKSNTGFDRGVTTSHTLMATEYGGSYEIKGAAQSAKSRKEAEQANAKTLKSTIVSKELANNLADAAKESGKNKNLLTGQQKALEKANLAANEMAKHLGGIEHGRPDSTKKEYDTFVGGISSYMEKAGKTVWDTMNLTTNKSMYRYHNTGGTLGVTDGRVKGEGKNHKEADKVLKDTMKTYKDIMKNGNAMAAEEARVRKVLADLKDWKALDALNRGGLSAISGSSNRRSSNIDNSQLVKEVRAMQNSIVETTKAVGDIAIATKNVTSAIETQTNYDKIEHSAERVSDTAEGKKNQDILSDLDTDLSTGFNTDAKADEAIGAFKGFENLKDMMCPCESVLQSILAEVQSISKNGIKVKGKIKKENKGTSAKAEFERTQKALQSVLQPTQQLMLSSMKPVPVEGTSKPVPVKGTSKNYYEGKDLYQEQKRQRILEEDSKRSGTGDIARSTIATTRKDPHSWITKLIDSFEQLTGVTANYRTIMAKTSEEQDRMSAERVSTFGLNKGRYPAESGDKISFARSMSLWRGKDKFGDLFKDVNLSEGIKVDTTDITDKLAKVLSGAEMFKAQTGGWKNNLMAAGTGGLAYAWQPSLEKTRALANGLNEMMANIREATNDVLQDIQSKESTLSGMKESGDLKFKVDGSIDLENSTNEAKTLVLQLEESKQVLASILGDVAALDQVVSKSGGKLNKIIKRLGFTSPILRQNNNILANLNAGLDKSGKALKFQTRMGEILNYTFQLMSRHIGQVLKNLLMMMNPISLLKKAFSDFASYDVKWQRTMNVIKYNLRRIIRPFMEWFAQQLVNILGIVNAIIKGVGQAFGKDWDLFDQSAANAEKMREEFEKINNVTASFDELHDISSESNDTAENDLLGDIYTPEWGDLYETITAKAKKLAEVLTPIFTTIGNIFKWVLDHWEALVAAWAAFKIAKALWNLLDWAGLLKDAFGAIGLAGFGNLLSTLSIIAGVVLTIKTLFDQIEWSKNWGGMLPEERQEQGDKNIKQGELGGAALGAGIGGLVAGPVGAAIGAALGDGIAEAAWSSFNVAVSYWHGDSDGIKHFSEKMGEGIGKTSGVVTGALIGASLGGPVGAVIGAGIGWAIGTPLGKALGSAIGDGLNALQTLTRGKGAFQKLKVTAEDVENAMKLVDEKTEVYNKTLSELQELEDKTGESGKNLYDAVENGSESYWSLSESQRAVYDKYKELIAAEDELNQAKKQSLEYSAKNEEQLAKESGDFTKYIATLQDGVDQGIISHDEMYDHLAQTYGSLDEDAQRVFAEQLPSYMRQSVKDQGAEYETFGDKVATSFKGWGQRIMDDHKSVITSVVEGWKTGGIHGAIQGAFEGMDTWFAKSSNSLKLLGATEDDVKASTEALADAQERQNQLQKEVDELQIKTHSSAEDLYNQLNEGTLTYRDLTSDQQLLVDKYADLQDAMAVTDEAAKKNVKNIASVDFQAAKTSGNYDTFISDLMAANERGEISTDEMYDLMAQAYADMDSSARESFESQADEHGLMVETIKNKSGDYLGVMGDLKKNIGNIWTDMKNNVKNNVKELTSNAKDKFEDLKKKAGEKWENIKTTASKKWDEIKNSAIGQKVKDIWKNTTTKFNDLKTKLGDKWEEIKKGASRGWQNIKTAITDWVDSLWKSITGLFDGIVKTAIETWEKVKNFFSGKGFRTNEQVNGDGTKDMSIATYAVGTNYVPSDGLAYLHRGEAVIPAKYNTPYQQSNNSGLEESIRELNNQVARISETVNQGIKVQGQFTQRGTDLVASVEKANSKLGNTILSNKVYAR